MVDSVNSVLIIIFNIIFTPFQRLPDWAGIVFTAVVSGFLFLYVLKYFSDQEKIRKWKDRIIAHILEMRLFNDSITLIAKAQIDLIKTVFLYTGAMFRPLLISFIPILIILIQINIRYGYKFLEPGETAILSVVFNDKNTLNTDFQLHVPDNIRINSPAVRIYSRNEAVWEIEALKYGIYECEISVGSQAFTKIISAEAGGIICPVRTGEGLMQNILYPGESSLNGTALKRIEVSYRSKTIPGFGYDFHWLYGFFLLTLASGFLFRSIVKVDF